MNPLSPIRVYDFTNLRTGTIVRRSPHWKRERCAKHTKQIGMIVEKSFYADASGKVICWPVIHWEGEILSSLTHPANAVPFRAVDYDKTNFIVMAE